MIAHLKARGGGYEHPSWKTKVMKNKGEAEASRKFDTLPKLRRVKKRKNSRPVIINTPSRPQTKPCWCRWTRSPGTTVSCFDIGALPNGSTLPKRWDLRPLSLRLPSHISSSDLASWVLPLFTGNELPDPCINLAHHLICGNRFTDD